MKYINPEKSCVLDVSEKRSGELERAGWKPYIEAEQPKRIETNEKKETENKAVKPKKKTANKTNKGKK